MSRGMHRHRSIRRTNLAAHKIATRRDNAPAKAAAAVRRDARMLAAVKAATSTDLNPAVQSWVARQIGKPFAKISLDEIKALA